MSVDSASPTSELDTFETLPYHASHGTSARPANLITETSGDIKVPSRPEKLNRRESRIGLRSIFGRQKSANEDDFGAKGASARSAGIRASIVSNWPYSIHGQRSEITLPVFGHSSQLLSVSGGNEHTKHRKSASAAKAQASPGTTQTPAWDPPPLYRAYPQAIRHAHLPACTLPTETILRYHEQRIRQPSRDGAAGTSTAGDTKAKTKRGHRRNSSGPNLKTEWTTKVFILVKSGYLLQYTGEGSFDRLPERTLYLGKDSAAFASDVIPGRHWVLQVSSAMDPEAPPTPQTNSIFARFSSSRVAERRQASDLLMIFESAEDMEGWIILLRGEIQALGGKKTLSETGKPKVDDNAPQLKTQLSQQTLVSRDHDRLPRVMSQEIPWDQAAAVAAAAAAAIENRDIRLSTTDFDHGRDRSFDDTSTVSAISHDGRQLDGLRDSTHRLSYVSSGQRTAMTSAGSSPASSPLRGSFGSQLGSQVEDLSIHDTGQTHDAQPWPQARPNASDIMQFSSAEPTSYGTSLPQLVSNFGVQNVAEKRYSTKAQVPAETAAQSPVFSRTSRRPPPSAISINPRPLSLVVDHPSPNPSSPDSPDKQLWLPQGDNILEKPLPAFPPCVRDDDQLDLRDALGMDPCVSPKHQAFSSVAHCAPRKHTSTTTIRTWTITEDDENEPQPTVSAADVAALPQPWLTAVESTSATRPRSSMADHRPATSFSQLSTSTPGPSYFKRFSLQTPLPKGFERRSSHDNGVSITISSPMAQDSSTRARSRVLHKSLQSNVSPALPCQRLSIDKIPNTLYIRQSMTNLADIPPPAPPPTRALPPLPVPRKT
ncbi:hypothetical protein DL546_007467 [Coniochaeta pulveracea]|uniref:PH domain-containing protein n=1 Tax=Coniochaeta pulveracea TaxID=177199 RepID=A0A420YD71_9PEZI|nr:hypothetical protein DL546_007467 [Coniochaeta pulveracea]